MFSIFLWGIIILLGMSMFSFFQEGGCLFMLICSPAIILTSFAKEYFDLGYSKSFVILVLSMGLNLLAVYIWHDSRK